MYRELKQTKTQLAEKFAKQQDMNIVTPKPFSNRLHHPVRSSFISVSAAA
jgi:hypothetical protein